MEKLKIFPEKLFGTVDVPPSKSMAHRAVIAAALAEGVSNITNIDFSDDIIATIEAMRALGSKIEMKENSLIIDGSETFSKKGGIIDCNESGSTLRFLVPISIAKENEVTFIGRGNLGKRPLNIYYDIFEKQNINYSYLDGELDLKISGALKGDVFEIAGNVSSQFITGLMFTLPLLKEDSKIIITTELQSRSYLDLTLSMVKSFGIEIINKDYKEFIIKGNQHYKAFDYRVEGDYSQGAFFLSAAAIGNEVISNDLDLESLQGDKETIEILESMGAVLQFKENGITMKVEKLNPTVIDASNCPDVIPILTVVAALTKGETRVINGERLRIKECDRLMAIRTELNKIGANIVELEDGLIIKGVESFTGGEVSSHGDHRIAMSMAIASTYCSEPLIISNPMSVSKSYPGFWEDFKMLGGNFIEWNMGE
ncbi:MAG: 3-phosphoshikimate 1-carboxyvinyltransferase [Sarcina sp.]